MAQELSRIHVIGSSGSGKTTLAGALASRRSLTHIELDAIFHQPDWTPLPVEDFRAQVAEHVRGERWSSTATTRRCATWCGNGPTPSSGSI